MKHIENNQGVTLLVLVITVVVLLIVGGVSVYSIVGQGKALEEAQAEQNTQKMFTFKQEVQMDLLEIMDAIDNYAVSPTDPKLISRFQYRGYTTTSNPDQTLTVTKDSMEAIIDIDLTVSVVGLDI